MYKILTLETGDVVYTSALLYVKKNPASGAWIRVNDDSDAEAVAVGGLLYNLPGKTPIEGFNTAVIRSLDVAANLQTAEHNIDQNSADVNSLIDAVCDVGNDSDLLINAVLELSERLDALKGGDV